MLCRRRLKYDKPFAGALIDNTAFDMADMADLCSPHPHAERLLGCSVRFMLNNRPRCYIYIAADSYLKKYKEYGITAEAVRRHEIAHCNGWPGHHPRYSRLPLS